MTKRAKKESALLAKGIPMKPRPDYSCADCGMNVDRHGEFAYMLHDKVWKLATTRAQKQRAGVSTFDLCCVLCIEQRLGRHLRRKDFNPTVPLNIRNFHRSALLTERMVTP